MEDNQSYPFVSDGTLQSVKFGIATKEEISKYCVSDCPISHPSQLANPFLGLPLESGKCESCGTAEHGKCEGHFGYIELPVPVFHPSHINELKHLLSLVCLRCMRMKKGKVKHNLGKEVVSGISCPYCRDLPPIMLKEIKTTDGALCLELRVPARTKSQHGLWNFLDKFGFHYGDGSCRPLLPQEALNILDEIPEETKRRLASKGYFPQNGFILQCLPVPPNCLTIPEISDGKSCMTSDISTSMLKRVLNKIELIKKSRSGAPNFEAHEVESIDLQSAIAQYILLRGTPKDYSRKYGVSPDASAGSAKKWLEKMKTLFISKSSGFSSRSVISGDSYIGINVIGLPSEIASRMTFEERVTVHNMSRLQKMVDERLCVTYKDGVATYAIAVGSKGHTFLRVGQIVNRQVMDGDIVFINRPPSTHKHSIQAFSVYIHDEHTVKMNPLICPSFGADFDGDCFHIFYPQSLAAKAEVVELFSVENQLISSHSGNIHLQFVKDSLLALKLIGNTFFLNKATAQQLAMFVSPELPGPALPAIEDSGPLWTVLQVLQGALPDLFKSTGDRHMINDSQILKLDLDRDVLQSSLTEIITSIFQSKGPKSVLKFFDMVQPLSMEFLVTEGYSITLKDFIIPCCEIEDVHKDVQEISYVLHQQRSTYSDVVQLQVENQLRCSRKSIEGFILLSAMGNLIDSKSDSAIRKVVEQIGFLGRELYEKGMLYSRDLVDQLFSHIVKGCSDGNHPSEAYGLINNSFIRGLSCHEMLIHSVSSREVIVRSSRGLTEPGTLFKNLMATLRDIVICYDGTVRNVCSNSVVQFEYGMGDSRDFLPGEPVGILAATAISDPAYKAVLSSSLSTNSSWELMKEILLCRVSYKNDDADRRVILYLNDCFCGRKFCKENAAVAVQDCLKRVTLRDCATEFYVKYERHVTLLDSSQTASGLVGHIHLDKMGLKELKRNIDDLVRMCQDVIYRHGKKKGNLSHFFRKIFLSSSGCSSQCPCLQFNYCDVMEPLERSIDVMAKVVCPILLDTIVKGDPRVLQAKIVWIGSDATSWVRNPGKTLKGELAVEVLTAKEAVKKTGDAWCVALDACLPVMHLIDSSRSIPHGIQQIQEVLGISCAFDQSVQRLSMVVKVLKEHLILIGNCMTCTGSLIGFTISGFKALFRSLKVQVPFTESTLYTPIKCFERAADKYQNDALNSVVSSCSWGKHVAVGTGTRFSIMWDKNQIATEYKNEKDVYDFLRLVKTTDTKKESTGAFLGVNVDDLIEEDECLSPQMDADFEKLSFDDKADGEWNFQNNPTTDQSEGGNSGWGKLGSDKGNGWGAEKDKGNGWGAEKDKGNGWSNGDHPAPNNTESQKVSSNWAPQQPTESEAVGMEVDGFNSWGKSEVPKNSSASEHNDQENWKSNKKDSLDQAGMSIWNKNITSSPEGQQWGVQNSNQEKKKWGNDEVHDGRKHGEEPAGKQGWGIPRSENANVESSSAAGRWNASREDDAYVICEAQDAWGHKKESSSKPESSIPRPQNAICDGSNMDRWNADKATSNGSQAGGSLGWGSSPNAKGKEQRREHTSKPDEEKWGADVAHANVESSNAVTNNESQAWGTQGWGSSPVGNKKSNEMVCEPGNSSKQKGNTWGKVDAPDGWGHKKESQTAQGWGIPSSQNANVSGSTPHAKQKSEQMVREPGNLSSKQEGNTWGKDDTHEGWVQKNESPKAQGWGLPCSQNANASVSSPNGKQRSEDVVCEPGNPSSKQEEGNIWGKDDARVQKKESPKAQGWAVPLSENANVVQEGWGHKKESPAAQGWGVPPSENANVESPSHVDRWNANKANNHGNQTRGPQGWGSSQNAGRGQRNRPALADDRKGGNQNRNFTPSRLTPEEEKIRVEVQTITDSIKRILHSSSDEVRLSEEDEKFILENVFQYHPAKDEKVTDKIDYVMADKHPEYQGTRCLFVVSGGESRREDFSYRKCLKNYVKQKYPEQGDSFNNKFSGNFATPRRPDSFTPEEEKIRVEVQPITDSIKRILHSSSDEARLSEEDEKFVLEKVFQYHPTKDEKVTDKIDYIVADKHPQFQGTRCFLVVSGGESRREDFSYIKCIENYVKQKYSEQADSFISKFLRKPRPSRDNSQQQTPRGDSQQQSGWGGQQQSGWGSQPPRGDSQQQQQSGWGSQQQQPPPRGDSQQQSGWGSQQE